jgi:hypothetical protein
MKWSLSPISSPARLTDGSHVATGRRPTCRPLEAKLRSQARRFSRRMTGAGRYASGAFQAKTVNG